MLLEEFDKTKTAVLNPEHFHSKVKDMPKTCVLFFSKSVMKIFLDKYKPELISEKIENATAMFPVYKVNVKGIDLAVYLSAVGAPACVSNAEELISMGVRNILTVGCCGCLEKDMEEYSIIIPTSAIRDEGTSYHYAPVSDETILNKKVIKTIEDVMKRNNIHYRKGKTWTTDAIFRETRKKVNDRIKQGAITVDMECSAMNVLCKFRGVNYGQIFYAADMLANEKYDPRNILIKDHDEEWKEKLIDLAFECGAEIDKKFK